MTVATEPLPILETHTPEKRADVTDVVRSAHEAKQPLYTIGGGTSLDFGLTPAKEGQGLCTRELSRVVDYTPRDMTIVVEAGVTMADIRATLQKEFQHLPIDAPSDSTATIGGLVATDWSGPRRYGYGTLRDYVIGISAVDGRGVAFKGGGRVVKNVAGYDFCKLLTGSMGTLGVITQLTLRVQPLPEESVTVLADCCDGDAAEQMLAALVSAPATPVAIDLLVGKAWAGAGCEYGDIFGTIAVRFDGFASETAFMEKELQQRLKAVGGTNVRTLDAAVAKQLLEHQTEFSDQGVEETDRDSPLVIKITSLPSATTALVNEILNIDPLCSIQAHAGSGVMVARFSEFEVTDLSTVLIGQLRPAAIQYEGSLTVLSSEFDGLTSQIVWGGRIASSPLMESIKKQFDPNNILNPGRYIF